MNCKRRGKECRGKENQDQEEAKQAKFLNPSIFVLLISFFFKIWPIKYSDHWQWACCINCKRSGEGCRRKENQDQEEAKQAKFLNSSIFVRLISIFF